MMISCNFLLALKKKKKSILQFQEGVLILINLYILIYNLVNNKYLSFFYTKKKLISYPHGDSSILHGSGGVRILV